MKAPSVVILAFLAAAAGFATTVAYQDLHQTQHQPQAHHQPQSRHDPRSRRPTASAVRWPKGCFPPDTQKHYVGALLHRPWQTTLPQFIQETGVRPKILEYYVNFGSSFETAALAQVHHSAFPIIQVDPKGTPVRKIARGVYDSYLTSQAKAVARFRCPVAISFGHEMNGDWYPWGAGHVPPAVFIAAWHRIHNVFRSAGARNVIWTWTVNRVSPFTPSSLRQWWPGDKYVDWVGVDGYYRKPGQTFGDVFHETLAQVRSVTHDPIVITETSVTPAGPQAANIENLFQGARQAGILGVVWFNVSAKEQWSLSGRPASVLAAFKEAALGFER
jgi:mannan endo-1,4-beta-mannosidase